jgi:hypothetical protein
MSPAKQPNKPPAYVISGDEILTIPFAHNETIQRPDTDGKFVPKTIMVSATCKKCGSINVIWDDEVQETEREERQMGNEIYYEANCERECATCGAQIEIDVHVSKYADGWKFTNHADEGCELVEVNGFVDALETFAEMSRDANRGVGSPEDEE